MEQNDNKFVETLRTQLDSHRFMPNKRLRALTDAVGAKYGLTALNSPHSDSRELSDDELEVWAAGNPDKGIKPKSPGENS